MKHFIGYTQSGELISVETYAPGGWPTSCDFCQGSCGVLADPECKLPSAVDLRKRRAVTKPELIGWLPYDCPCSPAMKRCSGCFNDFIAHHFVDTEDKTFVSKPSLQMLLSGTPVEHKQIFDAAPLTQLKFCVMGDVPDGEICRVATGGVIDITPGPNFVDLVFTSGKTEELDLTVPLHGLKGQCGISGKYVVPRMFYLRGWQS